MGGGGSWEEPEKAATEMARRSATEGCLDGNSRSPMNVFNAELMNTLMDSVLQIYILWTIPVT